MVEADPPPDFAAQGGCVLVKPPEERDEPGQAGETVVLWYLAIPRYPQLCSPWSRGWRYPSGRRSPHQKHIIMHIWRNEPSGVGRMGATIRSTGLGPQEPRPGGWTWGQESRASAKSSHSKWWASWRPTFRTQRGSRSRVYTTLEPPRARMVRYLTSPWTS